GVAVAIQVTEALHAPFDGDVAEIDVSELGTAIHLPQHGLPIACAAPKNVAAAVAVEIADILDRPFGWDRAEDHICKLDGALHLPEHGLTAAVAPQPIAVRGAVEVGGGQGRRGG